MKENRATPCCTAVTENKNNNNNKRGGRREGKKEMRREKRGRGERVEEEGMRVPHERPCSHTPPAEPPSCCQPGIDPTTDRRSSGLPRKHPLVYPRFLPQTSFHPRSAPLLGRFLRRS